MPRKSASKSINKSSKSMSKKLKYNGAGYRRLTNTNKTRKRKIYKRQKGGFNTIDISLTINDLRSKIEEIEALYPEGSISDRHFFRRFPKIIKELEESIIKLEELEESKKKFNNIKKKFNNIISIDELKSGSNNSLKRRIKHKSLKNSNENNIDKLAKEIITKIKNLYSLLE